MLPDSRGAVPDSRGAVGGTKNIILSRQTTNPRQNVKSMNSFMAVPEM